MRCGPKQHFPYIRFEFLDATIGTSNNNLPTFTRNQKLVWITCVHNHYRDQYKDGGWQKLSAIITTCLLNKERGIFKRNPRQDYLL